MPNHVTNILKIKGTPEQIEMVRDAVGSQERIFDFNRIIPMPEDLNIDCDGLVSLLDTRESRFYEPPRGEVVERLKKAEDDRVENFFKGVRNLRKYGYACWYPWAVDNWGTKWNAYELEEHSRDTIKFETAWSHPRPVYDALSKKFADVTFEVKYADEDTGHNLGHFECVNGSFRDINSFDDPEQFACEVMGRNYEEWKAEMEADEPSDQAAEKDANNEGGDAKD